MDYRMRIDEIIFRILGDKREIDEETGLIEDLGFTSLQLFELISMLEDEFDVVVSVNKSFGIRTIGDLYVAANDLQKSGLKQGE